MWAAGVERGQKWNSCKSISYIFTPINTSTGGKWNCCAPRILLKFNIWLPGFGAESISFPDNGQWSFHKFEQVFLGLVKLLLTCKRLFNYNELTLSHPSWLGICCDPGSASVWKHCTNFSLTPRHHQGWAVGRGKVGRGKGTGSVLKVGRKQCFKCFTTDTLCSHQPRIVLCVIHWVLGIGKICVSKDLKKSLLLLPGDFGSAV